MTSLDAEFERLNSPKQKRPSLFPKQAVLKRAPYEIAVLVPCYNEQIAIAEVVNAFRVSLPSATIYVYDNNSADRTAEIACLAGAIVHTSHAVARGTSSDACLLTLMQTFMCWLMATVPMMLRARAE